MTNSACTHLHELFIFLSRKGVVRGKGALSPCSRIERMMKNRFQGGSPSFLHLGLAGSQLVQNGLPLLAYAGQAFPPELRIKGRQSAGVRRYSEAL